MKLLATAALMLVVSPGCARAASGDALDRSQLARTPSFDETFARRPSFYHPTRAPRGRWKTNFAFGVQDDTSPRAWENRTLRPNKELEYYGEPLAGPDPFEWRPGELTIVARPHPTAGAPALHGLTHLSGLITTERSFLQRYGYFEARVAMPVGKGLWPAFWLLPDWHHERDPAAKRPQQEIDVFENIGVDREVYATVHTDTNGRHQSDGARIAAAPVGEPHDYGVLVTPTQILWYIDRKEVRRRPNKDFHDRAYLLLNLAVGGEWPGSPDATTRFPARMRIERVRAWRLKRRAP